MRAPSLEMTLSRFFSFALKKFFRGATFQKAILGLPLCICFLRQKCTSGLKTIGITCGRFQFCESSCTKVCCVKGALKGAFKITLKEFHCKCLHVNFAKFFRTPIMQNVLEWLLLVLGDFIPKRRFPRIFFIKFLIRSEIFSEALTQRCS